MSTLLIDDNNKSAVGWHPMTNYRQMSLRNKDTRFMFLLNVCLVLHYGKHDGIECACPEKGLAMYPWVYRTMHGKRPRRNQSLKHRNATRRIMRALDLMQPGLVDRLAERAMILGGFTDDYR